MRNWVLAGAATAIILGGCSAAAQDNRRPCLRDIVKLCGMTRDRDAIRACLAEKRDQLSDTCKARISARAAPATPAANATELSYGRDALQEVDYYAAARKDAPLVVFVHGGGWKRGDKGNATGAAKIGHFNTRGYAFASVNYRLVPGATVEQQATDVAAAVSMLRRDASRLGFDPRRIVLMGHSAGAHLVALVGTDPRYLRAAGMDLADIVGIVPIDGAAYNVPAQMVDGPKIMRQTYTQAFGSDPARQQALSPTLQAAAPNAPAFLILHVDREDGTRQSLTFGAALRAAGTKVQVSRFEGTGLQGHMAINRRLGDPDYPATPVVDAWLAEVFGG